MQTIFNVTFSVLFATQKTEVENRCIDMRLVNCFYQCTYLQDFNTQGVVKRMFRYKQGCGNIKTFYLSRDK